MSSFQEFLKPRIRTELKEDEEQYLRLDLNSVDRINNDTSDNCIWLLDTPVTSLAEQRIQISVLNVSIPNSWNTIQTGLNSTFQYNIGAGNVNVIIPEGNYDAASLMKQLNILLTASGIVLSKVQFQVKHKWTRNAGAFSLIFPDSNTPFTVLGFDIGTYNSAIVDGVQTIIPPNIIMLNRVYSVKIVSNLVFDNSRTSSKNSSLTNTIISIPVNVPAYTVLNYSDSLLRFGLLLSAGKSLDRVHFQLYDQNGLRLNLQGLEWEISLLIKKKNIIYSL